MEVLCYYYEEHLLKDTDVKHKKDQADQVP